MQTQTHKQLDTCATVHARSDQYLVSFGIRFISLGHSQDESVPTPFLANTHIAVLSTQATTAASAMCSEKGLALNKVYIIQHQLPPV